MQTNNDYKTDTLFREAIHNSIKDELSVDRTDKIMLRIEIVSRKKEKLKERLSTLYAALGGLLIITLSYFIFVCLYPDELSFGYITESILPQFKNLDFPDLSFHNSLSFHMTGTLKFSIYIAAISLILLLGDMFLRKRYFNRHKTEQ